MQPRRSSAAAVLAAAAVAVWAPAAHASPLSGLLGAPGTSSVGLSGCGPSHGFESGGAPGTNQNTVCSAGGLVFVGPSSNVNSYVGPTIITAGFAGTVIASNGAATLVP
jgi:hypothetical protein